MSWLSDFKNTRCHLKVIIFSILVDQFIVLHGKLNGLTANFTLDYVIFTIYFKHLILNTMQKIVLRKDDDVSKCYQGKSILWFIYFAYRARCITIILDINPLVCELYTVKMHLIYFKTFAHSVKVSRETFGAILH